MKWSQLKKRLTPSFLKRKKKESVSKGLDHLLYEFFIDSKDQSIDIEKVRNSILLNPYCLISKPLIKLDEKSENKSTKVSFYVLSEERGKEVENTIYALKK